MSVNLTEFTFILRAVAGLAQAVAYATAAAAIIRHNHKSLKKAYILLGLVHAIGAVIELVLILP
jgi:formate-dependent phosphoribosylglycinamide formyltransferase (GAR transformylase)